MTDYLGSKTDRIEARVGETFRLELLRQAVVPPYLMLMPFIELPDFAKLAAEESLDEDGVHGCTFVIKALRAGNGALRLGFRDLQSDTITHEKMIATSGALNRRAKWMTQPRRQPLVVLERTRDGFALAIRFYRLILDFLSVRHRPRVAGCGATLCGFRTSGRRARIPRFGSRGDHRQGWGRLFAWNLCDKRWFRPI